MYYRWLTRTALSADWDVMGVAWVVRDSLWNGSSVPLGRRLVSAESWALRTLKAASIDMVYAPRLLAARTYNSCNEHWVLRLLLVSPTRTFLCLVFDPLCNKPYTAGANTKELAIVNLIAEREGVEPRPQKRWDRFLGEFGSVAFVVAPLYSTFLHQEDGVSFHLACLLMLHCLLSRRVVNGSIQLPQDRLWLLREIAQAALRYCALNGEFISGPACFRFVSLRDICGIAHWRVRIGECNLMPHWHALCWHSPWVTGLWLTSRLL